MKTQVNVSLIHKMPIPEYLDWSGAFVGREHFTAFGTAAQPSFDTNITSRLFNGIVSVALKRNNPGMELQQLARDFTVLQREQAGLPPYASLLDKYMYSRLSPASQLYAEYAVATSSLIAVANTCFGENQPKSRAFLSEIGAYILKHRQSISKSTAISRE